MSFMLNPFILHPAAAGGIPTDYVARYLFDGDYTDETGTYNGTNSGSIFVGAGNGPNGTDFGILTGGGNYVELGASLATACGIGSGTVSCAFRTIGTSDESWILSAADSANNTDIVAYTAFNVDAKARVFTSNTNVIDSDDTFTNNSWQHVIYRTNGSSTSIRLNGVNSTTSIVAGSNNGRFFGDVNSVNFMTIGQVRRSSPISGTSFEVAFLTIYDRELSDSECASLETEY